MCLPFTRPISILINPLSDNIIDKGTIVNDFCFTLLYANSFAKSQKKKKKATTTQTIKKKKNVKKVIKSKKVSKNTAKANLASLIKETSHPIEIVAADSIPEKTITILSAFKPQPYFHNFLG